MKAQRRSKDKEQSQETNSRCGNFQKMAEMMKISCPSRGNAVDCCSRMKRMMGQGKEMETKETKETQKEQKRGRKRLKIQSPRRI